MAQQTINTGAIANDGTGDPLRTWAGKTNTNFTELYAAVATHVVGPAGVTDDLPATFDGTSGKLVKSKTYAAFKTLLALVNGDVGLGNVDNTSNTTERSALATLTNKVIDAASNTISNLTASMFATNVIDTDGTLTANSSTRIPSQSAIKSYVDNLLTGLSWKNAVVCATTANITLSGEQTLDGVLTSASRVLVKNQSTASQNGIYVSAAGAWSRAADMDAAAEFPNATVFVESGTANSDTQWTCSNNSVTIGSTSVAFVQVAGAGTYSAGAGLSLTGNQFSTNGTGSAATLTTARNIDGQPFDGSTAITVIAPGTHSATSKATPVDADEFALVDSAASNVLKKLTWANLKATLKTYFDGLYAALSGNNSFSGNNTFTKAILPAAPTNVGTADIDCSGRTLSLVANTDAIVAGNNSCLLFVHEDSTSGQTGLYVLGTAGGGFAVLNQGANWSNTATPASGNFGIAYDGVNNVWRIYNGAGATRSFQYFVVRVR
jgi:hypothetical protein